MMSLSPFAAMAEDLEPAGEPHIPVPGEISMIVLGEQSCRACRLMKPVLEELREEYLGKAAIAFYDIVEHPELKGRFNVETTPTILFYDRNGELIEREEGYQKKSKLVKKLAEMGVAPQE